MTSSRAILALLLVIIGGMVTVVHEDIGKLTGVVAGVSDKLDNLPAPIVLQTATMWIGKPRVPPVRHIYKKVPTVIDQVCRCKG